MVNSNLLRINVQPKSSFNTIITLKTETYTESSVSINNATIDEKYISEEISSHNNSAEVIDHTCDDNGNNLLKKWMSHQFILSMYLLTYIWMMMKMLSINIMHHFYHQRIVRIYLRIIIRLSKTKSLSK